MLTLYLKLKTNVGSRLSDFSHIRPQCAQDEIIRLDDALTIHLYLKVINTMCYTANSMIQKSAEVTVGSAH